MDMIFFPKVSNNKSSMEESPIIKDKNNSLISSQKEQKLKHIINLRESSNNPDI